MDSRKKSGRTVSANLVLLNRFFNTPLTLPKNTRATAQRCDDARRGRKLRRSLHCARAFVVLQRIRRTSYVIQPFCHFIEGSELGVRDRPLVGQRRFGRFGVMSSRCEVRRKEPLERHSVQRARSPGSRADKGDETTGPRSGQIANCFRLPSRSGKRPGAVGGRARVAGKMALRIIAAQSVCAVQRGPALFAKKHAPAGARQRVTDCRATHAGTYDDRIPALPDKLNEVRQIEWVRLVNRLERCRR